MSGERFKHQMDKLLLAGVKEGASDIHLKVGYHPIRRVHGELKPWTETSKILPDSMGGLVKSVLDEKKLTALTKHGNVDASFEIQDEQEKDRQHRFRVNVAYDNNGRGNSPYIVLRIIPDTIRDIVDVGFPNDAWQDIIKLQRGLVLVTGVTGSGKTTTLASILDRINRTRTEHIVTFEDPIEYRYEPVKSMFSQREIGVSVESFAEGVKYVLRQDPDIILIGEIRDRETADKALEAAATGHLVLSTLHTKNAVESVQRYVNMFSAQDHERIRDSLAANLAYVLSQQLIPYQKSSEERTLAMEVMNVHASHAIQHHIREAHDNKILSEIQIGGKHNMILMDVHLAKLVNAGAFPEEEAARYAHHEKNFKDALAGIRRA